MSYSEPSDWVTVRCGRCRSTFKVASNAPTATCSCGAVNRIPAPETKLRIRCGRCSRTFHVPYDSSTAVCSCGAVNRVNPKPVSEEVRKPEPPVKTAGRATNTEFGATSWAVETRAVIEKPYCDGVGNPIGTSGFKGVLGVPGRSESIKRNLEKNEWIDLSHTNLYGFNFKGLLLEQHDMSYSLLQKANFDNTRISFVSFAHSDMRGARFRGSTCYTLFLSSNLQYADFRNAVLADSDFRFADLSNSNLCNADLTGAALGSTNFAGAKMDGARFSSIGLSTARTYNPNVDFSRVVIGE